MTTDQQKNLDTLNKIAPLLLLTDISIAGGLWFFRENIFGAESMWMAAPIAIALMLGALMAYFLLQSIANKPR